MLAKAQEVQKHFFFSLQKCFTVELNNNKSKQSGTKVKRTNVVTNKCHQQLLTCLSSPKAARKMELFFHLHISNLPLCVIHLKWKLLSMKKERRVSDLCGSKCLMLGSCQLYVLLCS